MGYFYFILFFIFLFLFFLNLLSISIHCRGVLLFNQCIVHIKVQNIEAFEERFFHFLLFLYPQEKSLQSV